MLVRELPEEEAVIADVGAGTGIFAFAFAKALPASRIYALEVRTPPGPHPEGDTPLTPR